MKHFKYDFAPNITEDGLQKAYAHATSDAQIAQMLHTDPSTTRAEIMERINELFLAQRMKMILADKARERAKQYGIRPLNFVEVRRFGEKSAKCTHALGEFFYLPAFEPVSVKLAAAEIVAEDIEGAEKIIAKIVETQTFKNRAAENPHELDDLKKTIFRYVPESTGCAQDLLEQFQEFDRQARRQQREAEKLQQAIGEVTAALTECISEQAKEIEQINSEIAILEAEQVALKENAEVARQLMEDSIKAGEALLRQYDIPTPLKMPTISMFMAMSDEKIKHGIPERIATHYDDEGLKKLSHDFNEQADLLQSLQRRHNELLVENHELRIQETNYMNAGEAVSGLCKTKIDHALALRERAARLREHHPTAEHA